MPDQIPIPDASAPAQVSPGQRSIWWATKIPAVLLMGIAFVEVSCSGGKLRPGDHAVTATYANILNKLFPSDYNQYTIFELWTFVFAAIFSVFLLVVAWVHIDDPQNRWQNRSTNYLVVFLGMSLGWAIMHLTYWLG
jgi:hypothetical protein